MKPFAQTAAVVGCAVVLLVALAQPALAQIPQQGCGNEGEAPCGSIVNPYRCDTGLQVAGGPYAYECGCLIPNPFGGCLVPRICFGFTPFSCVNSTRRNAYFDGLFVNGWIDWALKNQRQLAQDEPLNWITHIGTHNSYNTVADGHLDAVYGPNQIYSITDQLRSGARLLTLDLYPEFGEARLCHALGDDFSFLDLGGQIPLDLGLISTICSAPGNTFVPPLFFPGLRLYAQSIKEISNWLDKNPTEIVLLDFEDYVVDPHFPDGVPSEVTEPLRVYLGNRIFNPLDPPMSIDVSSGPVKGSRFPTRRELLAAGKNVIVFDNKFNFDNQYLLKESEIVGGFTHDWFAKNLKHYPYCPLGDQIDSVPPLTSHMVAEERELSAPLFGLLDAQDVASAAECNYSFIVLDLFSVAVPVPMIPAPQALVPDILLRQSMYELPPGFARQAAAVWSWKEGDQGRNGDCAMFEATSQRWISANCAIQARFACAKPRSESGKDPLQWQDRVGNVWGVTSPTSMGSWDADAGTKACQKEFGSDFVFSAPRNGYQNRVLKDIAATAGAANDNIWLNYHQHNLDDKWVIGGSSAPVAKAGPNQVVECGNSVNLDASGSYSPDSGTLSYKWQGPFGIRTTQVVNLATPGDLPLGVDPILLAVTDSTGQTATDSLTVTVQDTTPPSLTVSLSTGSARRHSHFVPVVATITSKDSCDSQPPRIALLSIELVRRKDHEKDHEKDDEKDHDKSDIDTYFRGATFGTDDRAFELARGEEHDRTYIVTYSATDLSGNVTKISAQVVVEAAHDD